MISPVATSDGIRLAARCEGSPDAPALLFLNSIGCDGSLWDEQASALARERRVVRFDARGQGASDAPPGDYSIARLGRDALDVLDAFGIARADVCGLSLGGATAQWIAIHAPERVVRLTLANTASRLGSAEAWESRRLVVLGEGIAVTADMAMSRFFSNDCRARNPSIVARLRAMLLANSAEGYAGCCAALRDADFSRQVSSITAPTLVIAGGEDVSTPTAQAAALAAGIPGARLATLNAAHLSNIEQPAAFTEALRAHLETDDG